MANLPETPQWEDGIYQIEVSDPVLGGPDGITNRPLKQLASRTSYLKQQIEDADTDFSDHIKALDPHTQYAKKDSPTFTGVPTAPTAANGDNSKKLATTEFVSAAIGDSRLDPAATETRLWSPDKKSYIFIQNGGWGAYSVNSPASAVALTMSSGGTGAKDLDGARSNLKVNRLIQGDGDTFITSPRDNYRLFVRDDGGWGVNNGIGTPVGLSINQGGTGDTTVSGAKFNLQVDRLVQGMTDTYVSSPNGNYRLFVKDDGDFGVLNNQGTPQPLSLNRGGTGATKASDARTNLGLGNSATRDVGTGVGSVAAGNDSRLVNAVQRSEFTSGPGWVKFPDGTIIQRGTAISGPVGFPTAINLPIPFTTDFTVTTSFDSAKNGTVDCPAFAITPIGLAGFYLMSSRTGSATGAGANWIAVGK